MIPYVCLINDTLDHTIQKLSIIRQNKKLQILMSDDAEYKRPIFSDPPDERVTNMNNILSKIEKQEAEILKLLHKYKQVIPDDPVDNPASKEYNNMRNKNRKHSKTNYVGSPKVEQIADKIQAYKSKKLAKSQVREKSKSNNKTISYKNQNQIKDSYQNQRNIKLPSVGKRQWNNNSSDKKKQINNQSILSAREPIKNNKIKLYQVYSKNKQSIRQYLNSSGKKDVKNYGKQKQQDTGFKTKNQKQYHPKQQSIYKTNQIKQSYQPSSNFYPLGVVRTGKKSKKSKKKESQNIFDCENVDQDLQIGLEQQIAKPIPYRPYEDMKIYDKPNTKQKSQYSRVIKDDDDDKPTAVSLTFYMRNFNQKIKQQCQEQINYLYFSRAQERGSNKQWAEEIIKMFQKHDEELENLHKSMKYLQTFDEGFFSASIYQNSKSPNKL